MLCLRKIIDKQEKYEDVIKEDFFKEKIGKLIEAGILKIDWYISQITLSRNS